MEGGAGAGWSLVTSSYFSVARQFSSHTAARAKLGKTAICYLSSQRELAGVSLVFSGQVERAFEAAMRWKKVLNGIQPRPPQGAGTLPPGQHYLLCGGGNQAFLGLWLPE